MQNYDPISQKMVFVKPNEKNENKNTPPVRANLPEIFSYLAEVSKKGLISDIDVTYDCNEISIGIIGSDGFKYWWDNERSKESFKSFIKGFVADVVTRCIR